jgi:hypothetical protein
MLYLPFSLVVSWRNDMSTCECLHEVMSSTNLILTPFEASDFPATTHSYVGNRQHTLYLSALDHSVAALQSAFCHSSAHYPPDVSKGVLELQGANDGVAGALDSATVEPGIQESAILTMNNPHEGSQSRLSHDGLLGLRLGSDDLVDGFGQLVGLVGELLRVVRRQNRLNVLDSHLADVGLHIGGEFEAYGDGSHFWKEVRQQRRQKAHQLTLFSVKGVRLS